jgi:hypothetical protein
MLWKLLLALSLMSSCVVVHATGVTSALRWEDQHPPAARSFWRWTGRFIVLAAWMIVLHLVEITLWAILYFSRQAMPDPLSAWYFSAVTYTTTGYGDLVLPPEWRTVGAVEALTGILMCGWSTGFFFGIVSRMSASDSPTG